jgi:hypothetical protein
LADMAGGVEVEESGFDVFISFTHTEVVGGPA